MRDPAHTPTRAIGTSRISEWGVVWAFVVGLVMVLGAHYEPFTFILRDGRFYLNSTLSLLESASYEDTFARSWYRNDLGWNHDLPLDFSNVALGARGELYHFRPWLLPVALTPFYFAFWTYGALLFNALVYLAMGICTYRVAKHFAGSRAAAAAAPLVVFGTGLIETSYDLSVDALLGVCFVGACERMIRGRGLAAGGWVAAALVLKPTAIIFVPAVAVLAIYRDDAKRVLRRGVLGGGAGLGLGGAVNWWMFGAPWTFGYMRSVERVGGELRVANHIDQFGRPLLEGLDNTFFGEFGLVYFYGALAFAMVGVFALARRHRLWSAAVLLAVSANFAIFAAYEFESDRFHYLSALALAPALAAGLRCLALAIAQLPSGGRPRSTWVAPALAACVAFSVSVATDAREQRDHVWRQDVSIQHIADSVHPAVRRRATDAVAVHGTLNLTGRVPRYELDEPSSPASWSRWGIVVPRENLLAAALLGTAQHLRIDPLVEALLSGLAFFCLMIASRRLAPSPVRIACLTMLATLPPVAQVLSGGGSTLLALVAVALALASVSQRRAKSAVAFALLAAWLVDAPTWLFPLGTALAAWLASDRSPRSTQQIALVLGVGFGAWALFDVAVYGQPLQGPDSFVLYGQTELRALTVPPEGSLPELVAELSHPGPMRVAFIAAIMGGVGLVVGACRSTRCRPELFAFTAVMTGFLTVCAWPGRMPSAHLILVSGLLLTCAAKPPRLPSWLSPQRMLASSAGLLLVIGCAWRVPAYLADFDLLSVRETVGARVFLGDAPCDFLNWETMTWECPYRDGGVPGRTGWMLVNQPTVDGDDDRWFVMTSDPGGEAERRVELTIPARDRHERLRLEYGAVRGYEGRARVEVRLDDRRYMILTPRLSPHQSADISIPPPEGEFPRTLTFIVTSMDGLHAGVGIRAWTDD